MERTLIILKPDALKRGIAGEIITRFEKAGLKIIGVKMLAPDYDYFHHHYETISKMASRRSKEILDLNIEMMQGGPVIAVVLEGIEAVELVRKMVGTTEPKAALPGTIRGDYAHVSIAHANKIGQGIANVIHASGNKQEAEQEITHWFSEAELFDYQTLHESYTQPRKKSA